MRNGYFVRYKRLIIAVEPKDTITIEESDGTMENETDIYRRKIN